QDIILLERKIVIRSHRNTKNHIKRNRKNIQYRQIHSLKESTGLSTNYRVLMGNLVLFRKEEKIHTYEQENNKRYLLNQVTYIGSDIYKASIKYRYQSINIIYYV